MVLIPKLRQYQKEGIDKIFTLWRDGKRSLLFQMPTGTGKTVLFSEIVRLGFEKERKILIVVHRIELVEQITKRLREQGIDVGLIVAGKNTDYEKIVQVASVQTLARKEDRPQANLIIIDECHHAKAETYKKLWDFYPDAKFLGVTATPIRMGGEGFDDLFDELIVSMPVSKFIEQGDLVPITHYVCSNPDVSSVKQRQGDYVTKVLSGVMMDNSVMSDLIESYSDRCLNKSTIVFAVDVEHSKGIVERYKQAGISAAHIDATTPKAEREQILLDFKSRKISVISNVEIITEGFDFPECEAVQLARPTKSLALYLQMVGRVMRTADGKKEGIVLDNAGLWLEHGLAEMDREWSLYGSRKKREKDIRPIREIAVDEEGFIKEINRTRPSEIKGLKLVHLSIELKRLLTFEFHVTTAKAKNHKLISAYLNYRKFLEEQDKKMTKLEFKYIKKRLNYLNSKVEEDRRFKPGYWYTQERELGF